MDLKLKESLQFLKDKVDYTLVLKQNPIENQESIKAIYQKDVLPHLLQLRRLNRVEKNDLEAKHTKVKELNQKLIELQQAYDCVAFETSCLGSSVGTIRHNPLAKDQIGDIEHERRMHSLDEEEERRKELMLKLAQLTEETKAIEISCLQTTSQLNQVKPYIRQLLEKVGPIETTRTTIEY